MSVTIIIPDWRGGVKGLPRRSDATVTLALVAEPVSLVARSQVCLIQHDRLGEGHPQGMQVGLLEWRGLKDTHPNRGSGLSWLVTEGRVLSVELALLEEHGMTLPPETYPLRGFDRNGQLNWRRTALYDTRRARAKRELLRWVRRALTLGLWRKYGSERLVSRFLSAGRSRKSSGPTAQPASPMLRSWWTTGEDIGGLARAGGGGVRPSAGRRDGLGGDVLVDEAWEEWQVVEEAEPELAAIEVHRNGTRVTVETTAGNGRHDETTDTQRSLLSWAEWHRTSNGD